MTGLFNKRRALRPGSYVPEEQEQRDSLDDESRLPPDGQLNQYLFEHAETELNQVFFDSGAHGLYNRHVHVVGGVHGRDLTPRQKELKYAYYSSKEFYAYCDAYAAFLKDPRCQGAIQFYATVDVIFNPELSWKVLKYLEDEHGLHPVPVIHYGTPLKWIAKHLEAKYDLIGLGGLGQEVKKEEYLAWGDQVFDLICDQPSRKPMVRTHGFAMTAWSLMRRYPWWSVDSASWVKLAGYGRIYVPHYRAGQFVVTENPYMLMVSDETNFEDYSGVHLYRRTEKEQQIVRDWLMEIGVPLGYRKDDKIVVKGVVNDWTMRAKANLLLFERFRKALPEWPWPFKSRPKIATLRLASS